MAMIGSNTPDAIDYAREETIRLAGDYAELAKTVEALTAEADAFPDEITLDHKEAVVDLIKRIRDAKVRIDGLHDLEKQPHLRRGQGVDQFFFGLWDRLLKRDRKNRDGIGDSLNAKLTALDVRILAEEQARRRREAEETARIDRLKQEAAAKAAREAEERRLAAERAKLPETREAKGQAAQAAEAASDAARVEATVSSAAAEEAYVETLSRPADIMRTRTAGGTLSTMQQETFAEIEDPTLLDPAKLWAFVKFDAKQTALNQWAKSTDYRVPMAGAKIGRRPKSAVR